MNGMIILLFFFSISAHALSFLTLFNYRLSPSGCTTDYPRYDEPATLKSDCFRPPSAVGVMVFIPNQQQILGR